MAFFGEVAEHAFSERGDLLMWEIEIILQYRFPAFVIASLLHYANMQACPRQSPEQEASYPSKGSVSSISENIRPNALRLDILLPCRHRARNAKLQFHHQRRFTISFLLSSYSHLERSPHPLRHRYTHTHRRTRTFRPFRDRDPAPACTSRRFGPGARQSRQRGRCSRSTRF